MARSELNSALLANPELISDVLEHFGFAHIAVRTQEIRFARDINGNPTSLHLRLKDNDDLFATDYVKNISKTLFWLIADEKCVQFRDVVAYAKQVTGVSGDSMATTHTVFDGFFENKHKLGELAWKNGQISPDSLEKYPLAYSKAFLDDNIPLSVQKQFGLRYDFDTDRIVIPILSPDGEIIGAKGRANYELEDDDPKYLYLIPCVCSRTLFGYYMNKEYMKTSAIYICESEKAVMQSSGYGFHNFVGIAGNHLSETQCELISKLLPERIVLMLDKGLEQSIIDSNIEELRAWCKFLDAKIYVWAPDGSIPDKASPTDMGKDKLVEIINNQLRRVY